MTTREQFEALKGREMAARSAEERTTIIAELDRLSAEDPRAFEEAVLASARQTLADAKQLRMKEQLTEISQIVSMSYIAKHYFNKTKSWLSQRVNELNVNGKPAKFTQEEIDTLNAAFKDISNKIGAFKVSY